MIEDFDGPRPAWDALFVSSSAPHEALKLRLLNGTHSLLAYAGLLLGAHTVAEAWADEDLVAAAAAARRRGSRPDAAAGARHRRRRLPRAALTPLGQPGIEHRLAQIALDGDQKLPVRFAEPARERIAAGHPPRWIALHARRLHHRTAARAGPRRRSRLRCSAHVDDWLERIAADGAARRATSPAG